MAIPSSFAEREKAAGAAFAEHFGVEVPEHFGDPAQEYESVRKGVGLVDMSFRGKIEVTGSDRLRWLNGQITNDVKQLKAGEAYLLGEAFQLTVLKGALGAVSLNGQEIRVPLPAGADLWSRLVGWYAERAYALLQERVGHFQAAMGLTSGPVELKAWKRRWGECHPDGVIKFNWRLILLPAKIIDYVVVHELAHLEVPGHNSRFWAVVAKVLPDYAKRRQWLNRFGTPFLLWRLGAG